MANTLFHRIIAVALATTAAVGLSAGCATNESALFIRGVLHRKSPECVVKADPTSEVLGMGVLDREFRDTYIAPLLVGNQLVRRGSTDQLRTETSRVRLEGAIVTVSHANGSAIRSFSTIGTGFVDPGTGSEPGYGIIDVTLVPGQTGDVGEVVNVTVRVYGTTLGGQDIESADISFPVAICQGCLPTFPAGAIDPTTNTCDAAADANIDSPCVFGQDDPIDCRLCATDPYCVP